MKLSLSWRDLRLIPVVLAGALFLACLTGFYVWHEISEPPPIHSEVPPLVLQPIAKAPILIELTAVPRLVVRHRSKLPVPHREVRQFKNEPEEAGDPGEIESTVIPSSAIRVAHVEEDNSLNTLLHSAWEAYNKGELDTASQRYQEVLQRYAHNHDLPNRDALLGMAAIAQQRQEDGNAGGYYAEVLALDPLDPYAHAGLASLSGRSDGLESQLKLMLARHPETAALHFAQGNLLADQKRWGEALREYSSASDLEQNNPRYTFNLAVSFDHLGQIKLATQHYQRALQLDHATNSSLINFDRIEIQARLKQLSTE